MYRSPPTKSRGFSLIEVIVAMGIISTAMIALVGVMQTGVTSLHNASSQAIQSRIAQELIGEAQNADWRLPPPANTPGLQSLLGLANRRRYDRDGTLIPSSNTTKQVSYVTLLEEDRTNSSGGKPVVLDYAKGYSHLKKLALYVEYTPAGRAPKFAEGLNDPKRAKYIRKFPFYVSNLGPNPL